MEDDQEPKSACTDQALVRLQLQEARDRADAIARELDSLGIRLRHLDRISLNIEQIDDGSSLRETLFEMPPAMKEFHVRTAARSGLKEDQPS